MAVSGIHQQTLYAIGDLVAASTWFGLDDSVALASGRVSLAVLLAFAAANNRDSGEDSLGTLSTPTTIDFDAGSYFNKRLVIGAATLELTLDANLDRSFDLVVKQDATGGRELDITNATWVGSPEQPTPAANAESLYRVRKSSTTYFVSRVG